MAPTLLIRKWDYAFIGNSQNFTFNKLMSTNYAIMAWLIMIEHHTCYCYIPRIILPDPCEKNFIPEGDGILSLVNI